MGVTTSAAFCLLTAAATTMLFAKMSVTTATTQSLPLKRNSRITTRYDDVDGNYLKCVQLAAIKLKPLPEPSGFWMMERKCAVLEYTDSEVVPLGWTVWPLN